MRSGALISVSNISHIVGLLKFREKVRIFRITKIYRKNRLSVLTFFNHQWRPSGLPVMPISALFSLVSSVLPWISLVLFNIFTFLFFYVILHGQMHLILVSWEWPSFLLALHMQIFIRCLPRRSTSFSRYWLPIGQKTHGMYRKRLRHSSFISPKKNIE